VEIKEVVKEILSEYLSSCVIGAEVISCCDGAGVENAEKIKFYYNFFRSEKCGKELICCVSFNKKKFEIFEPLTRYNRVLAEKLTVFFSWMGFSVSSSLSSCDR
jgi:hypothetical protein